MTEVMLIELAKQVPSLGVLVLLVILFLKHLGGEGKLNRTSWHEHNVATNRALQIHSDAMQRLSEAIIELRSRSNAHPQRKPNNVNGH